MKRHSDWLVLGLTIFLTACNPFTSLGKRHVVDYKLNPHPKQRYDITMTIANAPGSFASVETRCCMTWSIRSACRPQIAIHRVLEII